MFYLTIVDPSIFDFYYTETMLIMVIIGGPGSFWGVLAQQRGADGAARHAALHHRPAHGALRRRPDRRHADLPRRRRRLAPSPPRRALAPAAAEGARPP